MSYPINRRQFLRGAGGFAVAMPFLSSLLSKEALAQSAPPKRFIAMFSGHGQLAKSWYPASAALNLRNVSGYTNVRAMELKNIMGSISPIFGSAFDRHREDMQILCRLDTMSGEGGHHASRMLGNSEQSKVTNTIDQIMAKFAKVTQGARVPIANLMLNTSDSQGQYRISRRNGSDVDNLINPATIFSKLIVCGQNPPPGGSTVNKSMKAVDRVQEHYKSLISNPRLSKEELLALQEHMQRLSELEQRLIQRQSAAMPAASSTTCDQNRKFTSLPINLNTNAGMKQLFRDYIDLILMSVKTRASNIITFQMHAHGDGDEFPGKYSEVSSILEKNYHNELGHAELATGNKQAKQVLYQFYAGEIAYMLDSLKEQEAGSGQSYLYNSLLFWGGDQGCQIEPTNHRTFNMPVFLAGQAGGFFKTGRIIDYGRPYAAGQNQMRGADSKLDPANPNNSKYDLADPDYKIDYLWGRPYNQLLVTLMQAMGLVPADYETSPGAGYAIYEQSRIDQGQYSIAGEANDGLKNKNLILPGVRGESLV